MHKPVPGERIVKKKEAVTRKFYNIEKKMSEMDKENVVTVKLDQEELNDALEKANRLKELLLEIHELIDSLGTKTT